MRRAGPLPLHVLISGKPMFRRTILIALSSLLLLGPAAASAALCTDETQKVQVAIAACSAAISDTEDAGEKARLLTKRAKLQRRSGDPEAAEASIGDAIELAPGLADAWIEKGYLENGLGNVDAAVAAHVQARDVEPDYWRAAVVLLGTLADAGRYQQCIEDAPRAVELAPERAHTYAFRGRCLYETGRVEHAIADYERAAEIGLEEAFLFSNLSLALLDVGRNAEALEAAKHAVSLDFSHELGQWTLVEALLLLNRNEEAVEAYQATQAAGLPDTLGRANELAWLLYDAGRPRRRGR